MLVKIKAKVVKGEKGYIYFRDDAADKGANIDKLYDGAIRLIPDILQLNFAELREYVDSGWCRVWALNGEDLHPSPKGTWAELSHFEIVAQPVPGEVTVKLSKIEFRDDGVYVTYRPG